MTIASSSTASPRALLSGWERALLVLPALAGLGLGILLVFLPDRFASLFQFAPDDMYIYQLAGTAIMGVRRCAHPERLRARLAGGTAGGHRRVGQ